ncbi:COMM domain-containing protein 3 [Euwallacea fornicatus]|uniref:COMM domain-containing protein 3 n=1 Tax=Euwallacea fornicatus TaxID=995702 RepID=UPI00338F0420
MVQISKQIVENLSILNGDEAPLNSNLEELLKNSFNCLKNATQDVGKAPLESNNIQIKRLQSSLLYVFSEFVRHGKTAEDLTEFLTNQCSIEAGKVAILKDYYEKWEKFIRLELLCVGNHLPHITDIKWKIDHIVKTNSLNQPEGPLFRISLKTNTHNSDCRDGLHAENVDFTCNTQELQNLVHKLKDAVNHCQKVASGHLPVEIRDECMN